MNSRASSPSLRGRMLLLYRKEKVTARPLIPIIRELEMATLKTLGARYFSDASALPTTWQLTFAVIFQTAGTISERSLVFSISSRN